MAGVIGTILELQKQGLSDSEVVSQLRSMNYSAQEITDAVNQMKIKSAVNGEKEEMHPSIMESEDELEVPMPSKKPKPKGGVKEMQYPPQYSPYQQYSAKYPASEEQQQQAQSASDIETIEEIAEELVSEKFSEIREKISTILDFRDNIELRITNLNDRLKRIENSIDNLQSAVLGRVQQSSQDIKSLGSEMQAMQGAFGKILNPLIDNVKELGRLTEKIKPKEKSGK